MTDKANRCLTFLCQNEGGWKPSEPGDPETYRGISREAWPSWIGWKIVDDAKPLRRGQVLLHLELPVLEFYEARFWDKFRLEERDEAMALVMLDYFAHSGAGPGRFSRIHDPDPYDVIRDRGHYMVDLACGFVSDDPVQVGYWTMAFAGGWSKRLVENLEAVRKLGAVRKVEKAEPIRQTQAAPAAKGGEMLKGSWRTTIAGFALGLSILFGQVHAVTDDDPATGIDMQRVLEALAAMGLGLAARDNGVSSASLAVK